MAIGMAAGLALSGAAGMVGNMMSKKNQKGPDIGRLMETINSGSQRQRRTVEGLGNTLTGKLSDFETDQRGAFGEFKQDALKGIDERRTALTDLQNAQGSQLARTMQERAFRPVRGATEFVRQNLATTKSGAAQEALAAPTIEAQQQFGTALNDLTSQIAQGEINLADEASRSKLELVNKELGFEQGLLADVFKFGTDTDKMIAKELLAIEQQQMSNQLQAIGFQISGDLAADAANAAASRGRASGITQIGGQLIGNLAANQGGNSGGSGITDIGGGRTHNANINPYLPK